MFTGKAKSRADLEQVAVVEDEGTGKIGNGSSSRRKAQTNPTQPQLLMRVLPLSTMANGESKNEVGEYTTHTTRQCIHVDKMEKNKKKRWVYMRSISSAASIFILHSQGIGKERKRERKRREETRTLITQMTILTAELA